MKDELTMKEVLMIMSENPETIFECEAKDGGRIIGTIIQVDVRVPRPQYRMDNYMWVKSARLYKKPKPEFPVKMGDQVLVRDSIEDEWRFNLFSHISGMKNYSFQCLWTYWKQLIQITDKNRDDLAEIVGIAVDPPTGIKVWTKEDFEWG